MSGNATRGAEGGKCRRRSRRGWLNPLLGWDVTACGVTNLASEIDVAVCRVHYYLQRMHNLKMQLARLWRPSRLQVEALEAVFRADIASYLVGLRQDAARLEAAQAALRGALSTDSSSPGSAADISPRKPPVCLRYLDLNSLSPRQPALSTLREESSRSDSDNGEEDTGSARKRQRSGNWDAYSVLIAQELGESLSGVKKFDGEASGASAGSDDIGGGVGTAVGDRTLTPGAGRMTPASASAGSSSETITCGDDTRSGSGSSSSDGGGDGTAGASRPEAAGSSKASGSAEHEAGVRGACCTPSKQDSSFARLQLLSPRSALMKIREQQGGLLEDLRLHSQRLLLVAAARRCARRFGSGSATWSQIRQRRQEGHPGQVEADVRALQHAVEATSQELLFAREPLLRRAEVLRCLAAAVDEAHPAPEQQLRHLPSLQLQQLPRLPRPRLSWRCPPASYICAKLQRLLSSSCCLGFCAGLWHVVCSCFCCCVRRPTAPAPCEPVYESTWLLKSPPRGYSTSIL